jgi:hypothetical protein
MEYKETLEQKKRRIYGRQYLNKYLDILYKLVIDKKKINLLNIIDTDNISNKTSNLVLIFSDKIYFSDKGKLKKIILDNIKNFNEEYYLFTSLSKECGVAELDSLNDFNFNFDFKDEPSGILTLVNYSITNKILLDYYEEDNIEYLEVEIYKS